MRAVNNSVQRELSRHWRTVNERIAASAREYGEPVASFICECLDTECSTRFDARVETFEVLQARADCFVLLRGHEDAGRERVVVHASHFVAVERSPEPGGSI